MSYTVLARRYRSTRFNQLIGQEPVARTLINAIATGGVGKTSMARLFARALNAPATIPDAPQPEDADAFPPDDVQQRMADAIMRGDDLNVIEIDGASNNSVDQARQLIANAGLSPTGQARHKIYIIDEVHMLSTAAFNALLKTMEEPPAHVKFILCTTEAHKVPATIQSRCQRFDFRNIATGRIAEHLQSVLADEGVEADEDAVWQVARLANGSMRDGLSLLDRLIAAGQVDGRITAQTLEQMLGLPPQELIVLLVDALAGGDVSAALANTEALLSHGVAQDQLIETLVERLRQLMLLGACGDSSELVDMSDDAKAAAAEQAKRFDAAGLVHMIALCENLQRSARDSSSSRALLDATVVRLALAEKMADVTALLSGGATTQKKNVTSPPVPPVPPVPPAAPAAPPPPTVSRASTPPSPPLSADELWQQVIEATGNKPALSWLKGMQVVSLQGGNLKLTVAAGQRDMIKFVNDARRQQLAELVGSILGRRIRVEVAARDEPAVEPATPKRGVDAEGRKKAMELPLVKQLDQVFEITLIDVRPNGEESDNV